MKNDKAFQIYMFERKIKPEINERVISRRN